MHSVYDDPAYAAPTGKPTDLLHELQAAVGDRTYVPGERPWRPASARPTGPGVAAVRRCTVHAMSDQLPTRPLGSTGEQVSILGMGGGHVAGAGAGNSDAEVVRVIEHAIDRGVTFMDNAWEYNDGRSETLMGQAIEHRRDEVFLMTKVCARDRAGALSNLEDSLRRLRTDVIDLWQFHEINYATDDELVFAVDGAAEAARKALADGKVRYVGCTGHKDPAYLLAMLGYEFPWSTVQMPVTVMDPHYKSFIRGVLPEAGRRNIGVIGMKALGGRAQFLTKAGLSAAECLRFALSQPVATLVSGMTSTGIVDHNSTVARDFTPLSAEEQEALLRRVRPLAADGRLEWYKSTQVFDSPPHRDQHGFPEPEEIPMQVGDRRSA